MAGPWEKYQPKPQAAQPWLNYQPLSPEQQAAAKLAEEQRLTGTSINPADGSPTADRAWAGAGKSLRDTGLGLVQSFSQGGPMADGPRALVESLLGPAPSNPLKEWADAAIAENQAADDQLVDTTAGFWGNVGGVSAQVLGPGATTGMVARTTALPAAVRTAASRSLPALLPRTVAGNAAQGGLLGSLQPTAEGDSRLGNTAFGGGGGLLGGVLPRAQ